MSAQTPMTVHYYAWIRLGLYGVTFIIFHQYLYMKAHRIIMRSNLWGAGGQQIILFVYLFYFNTLHDITKIVQNYLTIWNRVRQIRCRINKYKNEKWCTQNDDNLQLKKTNCGFSIKA